MSTSVNLAASDGHTFRAYRAAPAARARGGLVVLPEIFGVNDHIRAVVDGYAADGYLAIGPQLFDRVERDFECGYERADVARARPLMERMLAGGWDAVMRDVAAAVAEVASAGKVGVVGYCWGGSAAFVSAARTDGVSAAICYYGSLIPKLLAEVPRVPVQLHWGESDASLPAEARSAVERAVPTAESFTYAAGHGFNCDARAAFDATAARVARDRAVAFLRANVG
jgi:carboxymethylenebutenolidase